MPCCAGLIGPTIGPNKAWHGGSEARPKHGQGRPVWMARYHETCGSFLVSDYGTDCCSTINFGVNYYLNNFVGPAESVLITITSIPCYGRARLDVDVDGVEETVYIKLDEGTH
jgi:hypothetical protein